MYRRPSTSSGRQAAPPAGIAEPQSAQLHGEALSYVRAGRGPALLLIHGIAGDWESWRPVIGPLARRRTVIAPDLPGHGASAAGDGDFSPGGLAARLRDLLIAIGVERVTVVGHSLGGGVAMQFAYQFPEMTERLVLISSGGLGRELSPILRAAALPGADPFIAVTARLTRGLTGVVRTLRPGSSYSGGEMARSYSSLARPVRRRAFLATARGVVGLRGQRVIAANRLYLAEAVPTLIVWGERDPIIPARHGAAAQREIPGSWLEVFPKAKHFPQLEEPERLVAVLERFLAQTEPAGFDLARMRELLRQPGEPPRR